MPTIAWYVFFSAIALNAALALWASKVARGILQKWAADSRYRILNSERKWMNAGPFTFRWNGQVVLRFEAVNEDGKTISGWALCGGPSISFFADRKIKVQLD